MDTVPGKREIEQVSGSKDERKEWARAVWKRCKDKCSNCGGNDRLALKMVVPIEAGGKYVVENGVLLCRACEMAADTAGKSSPNEPARRPLNFWVSRPLYLSIQEGIKTRNGVNSMGSLVRYLMSKYVTQADRFDDLAQYQDEGADVKINVWVEMDRYSTFKAMVDKRGMTVTDAVKGLIRMYESEAEPLVQRRT
jgi:hypothetical protein